DHEMIDSTGGSTALGGHCCVRCGREREGAYVMASPAPRLMASGRWLVVGAFFTTLGRNSGDITRARTAREASVWLQRWAPMALFALTANPRRVSLCAMRQSASRVHHHVHRHHGHPPTGWSVARARG